MLMWAFGLRVSELSTLQERDFIIDEDGIRLKIKMSKGNAYRVTWCIQEDHEIFIKGILKRNALTFNSNMIKVQIKRIAKQLNISQMSAHSFRHIFATTSLELGYTMEALKKMLGHSSITTSERYGEVTGIKVQIEHSKIRNKI